MGQPHVKRPSKLSNSRRWFWRFFSLLVLATVAVLLLIWPMELQKSNHDTLATSRTNSRTPPSAASKKDETVSSFSPSPNTCVSAPRSFEPLGTFTFWGKQMNTSWSCPTSGMNNQLMMIMGKLHCFAVNESKRVGPSAPSVVQFRWKDITCSPTGGKEGRRRYAVGSEDYTYAWFRWSEIMELSDFPIQRGGEAVGAIHVVLGPHTLPDEKPKPDTPIIHTTHDSHDRRLVGKRTDETGTAATHDGQLVDGNTLRTRLCFLDTYKWSELPWLHLCPANVDHIWGTPVYWDLRYSLRLRPFFPRAAAAFLERHGMKRIAGTEGIHAAMALHVRRGDYANFCRENAHGRGRRKYRVPPFVLLGRWHHPNSTVLGSSFWSACYPSLAEIAAAVEAAAGNHPHIQTVLLMTNAPSFRVELANAMQQRQGTQHLGLVAFDSKKEVPPAFWPRGANRYTSTEAAWMDATLISMAQVMVLNRYSTFSQSALDLHILREKRLAAKLMWW